MGLKLAAVVALSLALGTPAVAQEVSLKQVHRVFIGKMPNDLDQYISAEITKQLKGRMVVVLDKAAADAILRGVGTFDDGVGAAITGRYLGLHDNATGSVSLVDNDEKVVLWSGEAGDRDLMLGFMARGGPRKVAVRLVGDLKDALEKADSTRSNASASLRNNDAQVRVEGAVRPAPTPAVSTTGVEFITNKDVLDMFAAGLGDEVIVLKINIANAMFDTATSKLIEFKNAGVSDRVISAILAAKRAPASPASLAAAPKTPISEPVPATKPMAVPPSTSKLAPPVEGLSPQQVRAILGNPTSAVSDPDGVGTWIYERPDGILDVYFFEGKASLRRQTAIETQKPSAGGPAVCFALWCK